MKNWFKFDKIKISFIIGLLLFSSIMYIPNVYNSVYAGTSLQFIWAIVVLILAPIVGFAELFITKKGDE